MKSAFYGTPAANAASCHIGAYSVSSRNGVFSLPRLHEIGLLRHSSCKRGKHSDQKGHLPGRDCTKSPFCATPAANAASCHIGAYSVSSRDGVFSQPRLHETGLLRHSSCKRGKLVGDKGYICKDLFSKLFVDGIQLITKLKNNMKGQIMTNSDKILLRKRALIETINDELKNMAQIEHSRHRSVVGIMVKLMAGLAAYSFFPKKPMIDVERVSPYENGLIQLSLF